MPALFLCACFSPESDEPSDASTGATGMEGDDGSATSGGSGDSADSAPGPTGDTTGGPQTSDGPQTSSGPLSSTGVDVCPGGTCHPTVPEGFAGPALVYDGTDPAPPCPASAPDPIADGGAGFNAPAAVCTCECGTPTGVSCVNDVRLTEAGSNCFQLPFMPEFWNMNEGQCVSLSPSTTDTAFTTTEPALLNAGGNCAPIATDDIAPPSFDRSVRACVATDGADACDGECGPAPDGDFAQVCVHAAGDVACVGPDYTEKTAVFGDFTDDRSCSACGCGTPTGSCGGAVTLHTNSQCDAASQVNSVALGGCSVGSAAPTHALYSPVPEANCAPSGGASAGSATPTGAVTLCCLPL